ncbi:MAG: WecB/TagA/CpsF family glycosyltransferase [Chthoniobacterales bacterium]|nr:WecB/TagA/CpsF family glycosyltransferase [Chthoniobacterales bacterium]
MRTHQILGINFFGGTSREAVEEISHSGGLLVAPAAPSMIALCHDEDYRNALLSSDLAIADSGFMVLLWKFFTGQTVPRISGLEHVKRLLEHESVREPGAVLWVVATETSRARLDEFLSGERTRPRVLVDAPRVHELPPQAAGTETPTTKGDRKNSQGVPPRELSPEIQKPETAATDEEKSPQPRGASAGTRGRVRSPEIYVAPKYGRPVEDGALLTLVRQMRPRHIVIAVGGGIQDKLGRYILDRLDYRPAVHCIGAALGFLTGDQVRIPDWADKYYVGWLFRSIAQPRVFIPRFWSARRLPWLIFQWREKLPPLEKAEKLKS